MKRIRRRPTDQPWSAPGNGGDRRDRAFVVEVRGGEPSSRRIAAALGRGEARRLALSPWFLAGMLLYAAILATFPAIEDPEAPDVPEATSTANAEILQDLPFTAHPFIALALLAGNRNATRARRDRTDEMFDACPTTPATRAAGAVCSAWLPVVALAVFVPAYLWLSDAQSGSDLGPLGPGAVPHVLTVLVLGAGGVALGIALGRWVRLPLAAVAAITLIALVSTWLSAGDPGMIETPMLLSTMGPTGSGHPQPVLTVGQAWFHFAWFAALTVATALVAVAPLGRHRDGRVPLADRHRP